MSRALMYIMIFFFFNDTATTEIYTLSHTTLFRSRHYPLLFLKMMLQTYLLLPAEALRDSQDRKSTRLNSSHANISYAVFCLKKKKTQLLHHTPWNFALL